MAVWATACLHPLAVRSEAYLDLKRGLLSKERRQRAEVQPGSPMHVLVSIEYVGSYLCTRRKLGMQFLAYNSGVFTSRSRE